jgi:hypothetical protein
MSTFRWCADGEFCSIPTNKKGIKIGSWTIEEDGIDLVFRKDNAPNEADKPHFRIAGLDGNVWINRSTARGFVPDNIYIAKSEAIKPGDKIALKSTEKNKCFDVGDNGLWTTDCDTNNNYQKWEISRR